MKTTAISRTLAALQALGLGALLCTMVNVARAEEVRVAVASNFAGPMQEIARGFERQTGHKLLLSVGSTGKFYAQIKNGAPFDLLLAADDNTPEKLEREGLAAPRTRFTYAIGQLALWSVDPGRVDAKGEILRKPGEERLAIADPRLAPYGAASIEVLQKLGVLKLWQSRLVQGESIGQAYQFTASGNTALGFVALSQIMSEGRIVRGSAWIVPADLHSPLRQDAVVLKKAQGNAAVAALAAYLKGDAARALMRRYGYTF